MDGRDKRRVKVKTYEDLVMVRSGRKEEDGMGK